MSDKAGEEKGGRPGETIRGAAVNQKNHWPSGAERVRKAPKSMEKGPRTSDAAGIGALQSQKDHFGGMLRGNYQNDSKRSSSDPRDERRSGFQKKKSITGLHLTRGVGGETEPIKLVPSSRTVRSKNDVYDWNTS